MRTAGVTMSEVYAPIRQELAAATRIFDEELAGDLPFVREMCDTVRSYRGKMLRPALLLLCGKATGELTASHSTLAAVVEMVHIATLVHDDVLDEADERRRQPTIRTINGNVGAVLLGDYLISHAFHLCSGLESQYASRRVGATTNMVCEGELLQNHHRQNLCLSESEYIDFISRKTASLTATCCELGAYFAKGGSEAVSAMHAFGLAAGIAFQIMDDVLDISGERAAVGKTLGRDIHTGKLTLPTIHLLANASSDVVEAVRRTLHGHKKLEPAKLNGWLMEYGSLDFAIQTARGYVGRALDQLEAFEASEAKSSLAALTEFIVARRF